MGKDASGFVWEVCSEGLISGAGSDRMEFGSYDFRHSTIVVCIVLRFLNVGNFVFRIFYILKSKMIQFCVLNVAIFLSRKRLNFVFRIFYI